MIATITLFILSVTLMITAIWFSFKRKTIINNHAKYIKYFPIALAISLIMCVAFFTIYYDIQKNNKEKEFIKLKTEVINLETSFRNSVETLTQPSDNFSLAKNDSLKYFLMKSDSIDIELSSLKNYLLTDNIFSKTKQDIKDSINVTVKTINNIKKIITTATNVYGKTVSSGFVYAGNINNFIWKQNNFTNLSYRNDTLPKVGDTLLVVQPIFVRVGETHYSEGKGWVNQELIGTLQAGKKIIVKELVRLPRDYYWLKFNSIN